MLALLAVGCAAHRRAPAQYDLDSVGTPAAPNTRLHASIVIPAVSTPSWLRTTALIYRLDYATPSRLQSYTLSQWTAPPAELLTQRLRQQISAANSAVTLRSMASGMEGYRLDVTLEQFVQVFASAHSSRCLVTLSATLTALRTQRALAQRSFHSEQPAPSSDAAGAVYGLTLASDACLQQIVLWLQSTVTSAASSQP